jgi:hypothetical protein
MTGLMTKIKLGMTPASNDNRHTSRIRDNKEHRFEKTSEESEETVFLKDRKKRLCNSLPYSHLILTFNRHSCVNNPYSVDDHELLQSNEEKEKKKLKTEMLRVKKNKYGFVRRAVMHPARDATIRLWNAVNSRCLLRPCNSKPNKAYQ